MSVLLVEPAIDENSIGMNNVDPSTVVSTLAKTKEIIGQEVSKVVGDGVVPDYKYHKSLGGATVYDENGNNLVNNKVYGDIAMAGDKLFMVSDLNSGVEVFSIPDKKIIEKEKETQPVEINTEVSTEVATNLFNEEDLGENVTIPMDNFSFEDVSLETPTADIEPTTEISTNYLRDDEVEKSIESMKKQNEKVVDMTSFLNQFGNTQTEEKQDDQDDYQSDPFANYQGVHIDNIDYDGYENSELEIVPDSGYVRDELEIVPDSARDVVDTFKNLVQENANKDRVIEENGRTLAEKDNEIARLKNLVTKRDNQIRGLEQKNELATSALRDAREALVKKDAEIESKRKIADTLKGTIDGLKYELSKKDSEIAKCRAEAAAYTYIKNNIDMYKPENPYGDEYSHIKY